MIHDENCNEENCDNGYLQVMPNKVWCYFANDKLQKVMEIQGEYNSNMAVMSVAAHYTDGTECDVAPFDRLEMLDDYTKRAYQVVEFSPTGVIRLKWEAKHVEYFVTQSGKVFLLGEHFTVDRNQIIFHSKDRPLYNQEHGRGEICSVSYYIKPRFYVASLMKEVRATQRYNEVDGTRECVRFPQLALVVRESLFPDNQDKTGLKTANAPRSGLIIPG
jgi:hypothetical protein